MEFSLSQFARPQLASQQQVDSDVFSPNEWQGMLGYTHDAPFNPVASTQLYANAMGAMAPSRDLKPMFQTHRRPTALAKHASAPDAAPVPSKKKEPKAIAAMASWCGFSKRAHADHVKYHANVQTLWCDKQDKNHALCKKTRGFPTYYHTDGSVMKSGYPVKDPKGFYESLK